MIRALIFDCFGVIVADSSAGEYRDDAVLDYIRQQRDSYKIGLLSNISPVALAHRFTSDELAYYFDAVLTSGEVGVAKPDPRIFVLMAERLGVQPDEAVMIDDLPGHCVGAQKAGLRAVQYLQLSQLQRDLANLANPQ